MISTDMKPYTISITLQHIAAKKPKAISFHARSSKQTSN